MQHLTIKDQLREERGQNEALAAKTEKQKADLDYVAMMTGIDLDTEDENNEE